MFCNMCAMACLLTRVAIRLPTLPLTPTIVVINTCCNSKTIELRSRELLPSIHRGRQTKGPAKIRTCYLAKIIAPKVYKGAEKLFSAESAIEMERLSSISSDIQTCVPPSPTPTPPIRDCVS
jgi:hypothetical protein